MAWKLDSDRPLYSQLLETLQLRIVSGTYKPGDKLPSVRDMAEEAGVNPNTMQRAFGELERKQLIVTERTAGRHVTEDTKMIDIARRESADERLASFIESMKQLGFNNEEIRNLVAGKLEEGKDE